MKALLTFAICLAVATPTFCQSTSAAKDQQDKEQQLRTALEQMRNAIDHYRGMADRGKIMTPVGSRNYPPDLETLVKGASDAHGKRIQFLSKIPVDPMTGTADWGLKRAGRQGGIFDVYTKSDATALDGTKYQDW
ncbi:MAG TPA: hypothetical protein VJP02_12150 [Candidatus Sulfotelmatobacter sp.]|nr:hypothetical protein [Candidatus Sulfotelmatobacter sp.]